MSKYFKIKMFWNRGISHLSIPLQIYSNVALLYLVLDRANLNTLLIIPLGIILISLIFYLGYQDVKRKWFDIETKINNKHNPELMRIKEQTRRKRK